MCSNYSYRTDLLTVHLCMYGQELVQELAAKKEQKLKLKMEMQARLSVLRGALTVASKEIIVKAGTANVRQWPLPPVRYF